MHVFLFLIPLVTVSATSVWEPVYHSPYFTSITSDASGEHLIAVSYDKLVVSSDYGRSWDVSMDVNCGYLPIPLVISANGQRAYFVGNYPRSLYSSGDSGATWSFLTDANTVMNNTIQENATFISIATDASGTFLLASIEIYTLSESLMISNDSGQNWHTSITLDRPFGPFKDVFCSGDGSLLGAVLAEDYYSSRDGGVTWNVTAADDINDYSCNFLSIAFSATGQYVYIGAQCGEVHRSEDYGETWSTVTNIDGDRSSVDTISVDTTGQYLSATSIVSNCLLQSMDFGRTWECVFTAPHELYDVAADESGMKIATVTTGNLTGAIYLNFN